MVDIGPNAESKEEVHSFVHVHSVFPCVQICVALNALQSLLMISNRVLNFESFGEKKQSLEDLKTVELQKAQVRHLLLQFMYLVDQV